MLTAVLHAVGVSILLNLFNPLLSGQFFFAGSGPDAIQVAAENPAAFGNLQAIFDFARYSSWRETQTK